VVTRLAAQWQAERQAFLQRDLSERDYVYCWADGIHFNLRLADGRLCVLVLVGVRADGTKELVAVADGERESADAWAELLRDGRRRGMRAPVLMVGDGALGLWRALREVFPETREQRCWVHKVANVLNALPKSVQAGARRALNEIVQAEDRAHAERAIEALVSDYGAKWPKAVAKVVDDKEALLCFFDVPPTLARTLRSTDESFKAVWHCRPAGTGLASSAGVVDPGAKSRVVGLEALPRSLPLEGQTSRPSGGGHAPARRFPRWSLGLPVGDELAVGDLGLLGQGTFAPADLLARVGGGLALLPAPR
jgi:hypothetical protein